MTGEPCTIVSRAPSTSAVTGAESASMRTGEAKQPSFDPDVEVGIVTVADETTLLTGKKLAIVFAALMMSLFLTVLDQTILATSLPVIASEFNAFKSQGWISSAFLVTQTAFFPIWGQLLRIYPAKAALLFNIVIFEIGFLVCGTAHSVNVLILGRALSGIGAAGLFISIVQILSQVTRLEDRPKLFGFFGGVYAIGSLVGPLMGGAFTDSKHLTWRWTFFINEPLGAFTVVIVALFLEFSPPLGAKPEDQTRAAIIRQTLDVDWGAALLVLGMIASLVYALQTGGNTEPWNNYGVILSLVVFALCLIGLYWEEKRRGETAMVPLSLLKNVSVFAILAFSVTTRFCLLVFCYYIPIYYQAGRGQTAVQSGVALMPLLLSAVTAVILAGQFVGRTGNYWCFLFFGPIFTCVGSGLFYSVTEHTPSANIIGYQILLGLGIGSTMQNGLLAVQAEFSAPSEAKLLSQVAALITFQQFLGGVIGISIAESVFSSQLTLNLAKYAPTAPLALIQESPLSIRTLSPPALVTAVINAYIKSLNTVFILGVAVGIIAIMCSLFIKNINIKEMSIKNVKEASVEDAPAVEDVAEPKEQEIELA